jgi:hypothetical protein
VEIPQLAEKSLVVGFDGNGLRGQPLCSIVERMKVASGVNSSSTPRQLFIQEANTDVRYI